MGNDSTRKVSIDDVVDKGFDQGAQKIIDKIELMGKSTENVTEKFGNMSSSIEHTEKVIKKVGNKIKTYATSINDILGDKSLSSKFGSEKEFKQILGYFAKIEDKQESLNKLQTLGKAARNKNNILKYYKEEKDALDSVIEAYEAYNQVNDKHNKQALYRAANAYEAQYGDAGFKTATKLGNQFLTVIRDVRSELDKNTGLISFRTDSLKEVFSIFNDAKNHTKTLKTMLDSIDTLGKSPEIFRKEHGNLESQAEYLKQVQEYLILGGEFNDKQSVFIKSIQNAYNQKVSEDLKVDVFNVDTTKYLLDLAATTEMVAAKKENADGKIQESSKETANVVEQSAEQEVEAQQKVGASAEQSARKQKKAKESTKKTAKQVAEAAQESAAEQVAAEERVTTATIEGAEKQTRATKEQIESQKKLEEAYRDTLKNKSISSLENNIAQNEYKIKKGDKNKEELEWQLPILKEVLSLKQKEAEKQKYIEQETKRVRKEMDKQEKGRLANIERETRALEQQREEVERQKKEAERLENISKEQLRIRNEQDDDAKYLSQRGIVGDEAGWSVVKELGFARTQQINYGYNKDTGLLEENPADVITNYEKLKNAIIATDKAVQTLEHDLKVIQTKHPGIDTSYLEKNLSAAKNHFAELNKERNLYAQSADYMETYIKHNKEIEAAHDKTKNSLAQKDVVSKYAEQLRAEKDAKKLLIDTNNKLLSLEEERFRIQNSLNLGKSKNEIKDKERILAIEEETNDLLLRRNNLKKNYNTYDLDSEKKYSEIRKINNKQLVYNKSQLEQKKITDEYKKQVSIIEEYNKQQSKLNLLKAESDRFGQTKDYTAQIKEQKILAETTETSAKNALKVIYSLRQNLSKDDLSNAFSLFQNAKNGSLSQAKVSDIQTTSDKSKLLSETKAKKNEIKELSSIYAHLFALEKERFKLEDKINLNKSQKTLLSDTERLVVVYERINKLLDRRDKLNQSGIINNKEEQFYQDLKQAHDVQLKQNDTDYRQNNITKIYKSQLEIIEKYNKEQSKLNLLKEKANKIDSKNVYDERIRQQKEIVDKMEQKAVDAYNLIKGLYNKGDITRGQFDDADISFQRAIDGSISKSQVSDMQATKKRIQAAKTEKQALESLDSTIKNVETSFKNLAKVSSVKSNEYSLTNALDTVESAIKRFNLEKQAAIKSGINQVDIDKKETDLLDSLGISVNDSTVGAISKLSDKIHSAMQEIFESGKLSSSASNDFIKLHSSLKDIIDTKNLSSFDGIKKFLEQLSVFSNEIDGNLDKIRKQNEITWITDMASGFDKCTNKSDEFVNTLSTLKSKISAYNQALAGKDANLIGQLEGSLLKDAPKLINKLNNMLSGKGTLFEDSEGQVHALSDLNTWILKYANSQKLVLEHGSKLKTENNAVTGNCNNG